MSWIALEAARVRGLRRVEYDRIVQLGLFERERLELIRGQLVAMSPQDNAHALCVERVMEALMFALARRARVRCQLPFAPSASDDSEPEPDVAVFARDAAQDTHPGQALLIVEVADSSLRYDRLVKGPLYAEVGVPQYWLVNLVDRVVEVHTAPRGGIWSRTERVEVDGEIEVVAFPDVRLRVGDLLP